MTSIMMTSMTNPDFNFKSAWNLVHKLENEGLYKSALEEVDKIYDAAFNLHVKDQIIKSTIYKSKLTFLVEDIQETHKIIHIKQALEEADSKEVKAIFHLLLADLYSQYLNSNMYRIKTRTFIKDNQSEELEDWSIHQIQSAAHQNIEKAVSFIELKDIPLEDYLLLFNTEHQERSEKFPDFKNINLLEFIYVKAIHFYQNTSTAIGLYEGNRFLKNENVFLSIERYLAKDLSIQTHNIEKAHFYFQKLLALLQSKNNKNTFERVQFWKLDFENRHSILPEKFYF